MRVNWHTCGMGRSELRKSSTHTRCDWKSQDLTITCFQSDRPNVRLRVQDQDRLDFDEGLLPEDSWDTELDEGEYEVERFSNERTGRLTRYGRKLREFLAHWKGFDDPTWVDEADLNCGVLLHGYLRNQTNRSRFGVMQSHEEQ
ncbi:hypothetical protein F443_22365 [Phytophthora nicotianae P1569]|uniref:Chromo domain-containing protein n=1 Tax=Phytophthora nicotianae P1569 TaxID=1317065 RepID=V9DWX9_PHYNI|nr:hypothetical protein F443_22365 [Phytophthora nicotianae P1569]